MKKIIIISLIFLVGCSKDSEITNLSVNVKLHNKDLYSGNNMPLSNSTIYVFNDINWNYPVLMNYEYLGNGILKNKTSGVQTNYSKKIASNSSQEIIPLPNGTYTVIVDIVSLVKIQANIGTSNGSSIKLPESNTMDVVFEIWPYSATDLGL